MLCPKNNMEYTKAIVSKEKEYSNKIKKLRRLLFDKEIELEKAVEEYVAFDVSIKNFYKNYYLKKLGDYIVLLENLKDKLLGIRRNEKEGLLEGEEKEDVPFVDEGRIKKIYRNLVKIYHPDNFKNMEPEDKDFYDFRMSEINQAFEKRDIKTLERIMRKADMELGLNGKSPVERIKNMQDDIYIVEKMTEIYKEKMKLLKENEMALLMQKTPNEREKAIEELKERFISEIKTYQRICSKVVGYQK